MTIRNIKPVELQKPISKLRGKGGEPIVETTNPKQIADAIDTHQMFLGIFLPKKLGKLAKTISVKTLKVRKDVFISKLLFC